MTWQASFPWPCFQVTASAVTDDGNLLALGMAVQVDSIKTHVESAYGCIV